MIFHHIGRRIVLHSFQELSLFLSCFSYNIRNCYLQCAGFSSYLVCLLSPVLYRMYCHCFCTPPVLSPIKLLELLYRTRCIRRDMEEDVEDSNDLARGS